LNIRYLEVLITIYDQQNIFIMKTIITLVTVVLFCNFLPIKKNNGIHFNQPKEVPILMAENNEYWHELIFSTGLTAQCKRIEGQYTIAYYNGPLTSPYPCTSSNDLSKRKMIILHDVEVEGILQQYNEEGVLQFNLSTNKTLTIKSKNISKDPSTIDQWTYTDIKIEKMVSLHDYTHTSFKKIEISYTEEKTHNSYFDRN